MKWIEEQRALLAKKSGSGSKGSLKEKFLTKVRRKIRKARVIQTRRLLVLENKRRKALKERSKEEAHLKGQKGAP